MSHRGDSSQRGFNILESLVVMLVIILLASIVIPGLLGRVGEEPKLPEVTPPTEENGGEQPEGVDEPDPVSTPEQELSLPNSESVVGN